MESLAGEDDAEALFLNLCIVLFGGGERSRGKRNGLAFLHKAVSKSPLSGVALGCDRLHDVVVAPEIISCTAASCLGSQCHGVSLSSNPRRGSQTSDRCGMNFAR